MYALSELQELALSHPGVDAPDAVVAAWYDRKATVLEHLGRPADAEVARAHAARLATVEVHEVAA